MSTSSPVVRNSLFAQSRLTGSLCLALLAGGSAGLTGCGIGLASHDVTNPQGLVLHGSVHGGQQPLSGSSISLYAISQTGYKTASTSLLTLPVTSDINGNFNITADYVCPTTPTYIYALATGGNPGLAAGTNNSKIGLMSSLGLCSGQTPATFITLNEVTTLAAAYALAPFAATETSIGTSSTNFNGLANAVAVIPNLVTGNGYATLMTPAGNGTAPQAELNTLANALAACINTNGTSSACTTLFSAANVTGAGGTPIDTIQAAINIAQNPGVNVASIYNITASNGPFQPTLTAAPNDWTMAIAYTGNFNQVQGISVDATGNIYLSNSLGASLTELSPTGANITPASMLATPSMFRPQQVGIDLLGNIWVANRANTNTGFAANLTKFSSNGTLLSGTTGFTGGGLNTPRGLTIDIGNNVYASGNSEISYFNNAGTPIVPNGYLLSNSVPLTTLEVYMALDPNQNVWTVGFDSNNNPLYTKLTPLGSGNAAFSSYTQTNALQPNGIAFDQGNHAWIASSFGGTATNGSLIELNATSGAAISPAGGYIDGGVNTPNSVSVDGLGTTYTGQSQFSVRTNAGVAISPATGYQLAPTVTDCCLQGALDGSGGFWLTGVSHVYQVVGLAAPVVTPLVLAVKNGTQGTRP